MSSTGEGKSSIEISNETLAEMVHHLRSSWTPEKIEHVEEGVNSTVALDVNTPTGNRRIVLKAITSSHPLATDRGRAESITLSLLQRETAVPVPTVFGTCDDHEAYPTHTF